MEIYVPFRLVIRMLNVDIKKDIVLSFKTFDVILPNIANEGS